MTTAADLHAEADRRVDDAIREGLEQLVKGWRPREVVTVLADAARIVADLREQAGEQDDLEQQIRDHDELTIARVRGFGWVEDEGRAITESLERSNAWYAQHPRLEATS